MVVDDVFKYIRLGIQDCYWYEEHEKLFTKLFGKEKLELVAKIFAATSINSSLKSNVRLFRKALYEIENNLPFSNYLPVMRMQLERIRASEPIQGQKIKAFAAALSGDENAVVVDIWLLRAFGEDRQYFRKLSGRKHSGGATERQFKDIESWVRDNAPIYKLTPRQLSASIWSGVRIFYTGDKQTKYKEVLELQMYNMFETKNNE